MKLFRTPMTEISMEQEVLELIIVIGATVLILFIGQIIYQIEKRYQHDRDYRRSKGRGVGKQFGKTDKDGKHRQELGKVGKGREHHR